MCVVGEMILATKMLMVAERVKTYYYLKKFKFKLSTVLSNKNYCQAISSNFLDNSFFILNILEGSVSSRFCLVSQLSSFQLSPSPKGGKREEEEEKRRSVNRGHTPTPAPTPQKADAAQK